LEFNHEEGPYLVKGGKTIIGRIFQYQEKTGMTPAQILKLPYIQFVLGMLDAPSIDYSSKKEKATKPKVNTPKTADDEINAVIAALR